MIKCLVVVYILIGFGIAKFNDKFVKEQLFWIGRAAYFLMAFCLWPLWLILTIAKSLAVTFKERGNR